MKSFRNIYVKGYRRFPHTKLKGRDVLRYTGAVVFYTDGLPKGFNPKTDMVFDCDCEFENWSKLEKVFGR